jgi:hypothetical protein
MLLPVPSGAVLEVEPPQLRAVLVEGGSDEALVDAVWMHRMDAGDLLPEDVTYLASWCIEQLAEDDEAVAFSAVCERFGCAPSERLRIEDRVLAYECDCHMSVALLRARTPDTEDDEERSDQAVRFTTGGPE